MFQKIEKKLAGQASILIILMTSTFVLIIGFVVSTGLLVHAKINLQNAADLAAYAGAAVQARRLTAIAYLNYEMRRQWKKFLFKLYVLGTMGLEGAPKTTGLPTSGASFYPSNQQPDQDNSPIPYTCIEQSDNSRHCHLISQAQIDIPASNNVVNAVLDMVQSAFIDQLTRFEQLRQNICFQNTQANILTNTLWLYNTDPQLRMITNNPTVGNLVNTINAYVRDIGIVPALLILKFRILSLMNMVNKTYSAEINSDFLNRPLDAGDEAAALAFKSAFYTLGPTLFDAQSISLQQLAPTQAAVSVAGGISPDEYPRVLLSLNPIQKSFDTFAKVYQIGQGFAATNSPADCVGKLMPISVGRNGSLGLTLGFSKDERVMTYYAVRLSANAKILFWPFRGTLTLSAYSAAKPFGSRIGPPESAVDFVIQNVEPNPNIVLTYVPGMGNIAAQELLKNFPSLSIRNQTTDRPSTSQGWDTQDFLGFLYSVFTNLTSPSASATTLSFDRVFVGYQFAMMPTPSEAGSYTIPTSDDFWKPNSQNIPTNGGTNVQIYAPIFYPNIAASSAQTIAKIQSAFQEILSTTQSPAASLNNLQMDMVQGLASYIQNLQTTTGLETFDYATVGLYPQSLSAADVSSYQLGVQKNFFSPEDQLKRAWSPDNILSYTSTRRVGYSVKFTSFFSLSRTAGILNPVEAAGGILIDDITHIKH